MKFPRNVKVFRGELNAAPLVSVFFLLVLFVVLTGLVYTPGILIQLDPSPSGTNAVIGVIGVTRTGTVRIMDGEFPGDDLAGIRDRLAALPEGAAVRVEEEIGAPKDLAPSIRELVRNAGRIELPVLSGRFGGTANRTVAVAMNFSGQLFYENRRVSEDELRMALSKAVGARPDPLTLVVLADRAVDNGALMRLSAVAREAGIRELLLAALPGTFESSRIR